MDKQMIHDALENAKNTIAAKINSGMFFESYYDDFEWDEEGVKAMLAAEMQILEDIITPTSEPDLPFDETQQEFLKEVSE